MSLRSLEYAIIESFAAIKRNSLMAIASTMLTAVTLGILGGFSLSALAVNNATQDQLEKFEISVWMSKEPPADKVNEYKRKIRTLPHVMSVSFVSSADTQKLVGKDLVEGIDPNSIDFSTIRDKMSWFRVRLDDPRYTTETVAELQKIENVEKILAGKGIVEKMVKISDAMKITGIVIAAVLLFLAMFVTSNTIRLMIHSRRHEIRIMKLVGASNWFVRLPFIFEGTTLGILGGAVACGLVLSGAHYIATLLLQSADYLGNISSGVDPLWTVGALVGLGWIIGALGSIISIQRYLKA